MCSPTEILLEVCNRIALGDITGASSIVRAKYPFQRVPNVGRKYTEYDSLRVFLRDGFVDRYSGSRLVNPAVLRLLSALLPEDFPAHPNWKHNESHIAYWELFPTIDHLVPVARGGADIAENWVTTSMLRNSAKANALLEEIEWHLYPKGDIDKWDGLTRWIVEYVAASDNLTSLTGDAKRHVNYILRWVRASKRALEEHDIP